MRRVLVIGPSGAGKSTFARALRDKTGLPLIYLDMIWHRPDGTHISRETFDEKLREILERPAWIIDGNYARTLETRLRAADTVFLLDYPVEVCLQGVASRRGKPREDMPWIETEEDQEFTAWIRAFPAETLPEIYRLLEQYREGREIYIFHDREDAERWMRGEFS